jgi:mono/diheme cytochrome c family protein
MGKPATAAALILTCLCLPGTSRGQDGIAPRDLAPDSGLQPFLQTHCFDCHDADQQEGDLNLAELSKSPVDFKSGPQWAIVLKRIEAGEMPPKKKKRPAEEELRKAVA